MTREEFTVGYATRSGLTVDELGVHGLKAYLCTCDVDDCEGWQMLSDESARTQVKMGFMSQEDYEKGSTV